MIEKDSSEFGIGGIRVSKRLLAVVLVAGLALIPVATRYTVLSDYILTVAIRIFVFAIGVLSYDLLFGYSGLLSFGHALFFGGGTYGVILLITGLELSYLVAFPITLLAMSVVAVVVGAISLRVSGVYFAILTLAFAQIGYQFLVHFNSISGGRDGISAYDIMPEIGGIDFGGVYPGYVVTLVVLILVYLLLRRLINSQFGRILQGIRENEERIQMLGVNTYRYKLISFTIAGALASVSGMMYLFYATYVDVSLMNWHTSGDMIMMGLLGGFGTLWGGILGAAAFIAIGEFLSGLITDWRVFLGAVFVAFVLFLPGGLASLVDEGSDNPVRAWIRQHLPGGDSSTEANDD